jgi:hypothetical protein
MAEYVFFSTTDQLETKGFPACVDIDSLLRGVSVAAPGAGFCETFVSGGGSAWTG